MTIGLMAEGFGERASTAGIVSLQGMVTIFVVLALLWGVVEILHRCFSPKTEKKAKVSEALQEVAPATSVAETSSDDGTLIAVITAAVAASMKADGYTGGFRVVSFKRAAK